MWLLPPTQEVPIAKHPLAKLIPLVKVEVAAPERLSAAALIPAVKVEVALPVTVRTPVEREVDVALVVVEFNPVKFCSVDDPLERRLEALIAPPVMLPVLSDVEKRFVDDEVLAKKLVLVELVVVDCSPVKFWSVDEPVARMLAAVSRELMKPLVAVREVEKKLVEVD